MTSELYQEYLRVIGRLKDVHGFTVDVDHQDIHTFYHKKRQIFKLFFGIFHSDNEPSIVVSFHIDLYHPEAIGWFINIYRQYPNIAMHDSYIEDSNGETYLGEDALALKETYMAQDILNNWLDGSTRDEIKEFAQAKVTGRQRNPFKSFDSHTQRHEATIELERMKRPNDDDEIQ